MVETLLYMSLMNEKNVGTLRIMLLDYSEATKFELEGPCTPFYQISVASK